MIGKAVLGRFMAVAGLLAATTVSHAQEAVPAALKPPAGYAVAFTAKASGVQIYTSTSEGGAAPKWKFDAPLAELSGHGQTIHHYAGPSWEAADGSKVARDMDAPVVTVAAKQAAADIPWLLIKVAPDATPGILSKVVYVQRIETKGGVAPAALPTREGTKVGVPYTATYVFYVKSS